MHNIAHSNAKTARKRMKAALEKARDRMEDLARWDKEKGTPNSPAYQAALRRYRSLADAYYNGDANGTARAMSAVQQVLS